MKRIATKKTQGYSSIRSIRLDFVDDVLAGLEMASRGERPTDPTKLYKDAMLVIHSLLLELRGQGRTKEGAK